MRLGVQRSSEGDINTYELENSTSIRKFDLILFVSNTFDLDTDVDIRSLNPIAAIQLPELGIDNEDTTEVLEVKFYV